MRFQRSLPNLFASLALILLFGAPTWANSIPSRTNSGYGESGNPTTYTAEATLNDLTGNAGTFITDLTPPAGFSLQVLCPFSTGCAQGGASYGWVLENTAPLTPGSQITIDFGSDFFFNSLNQWTNFMTCDPSLTVVGPFCMPAGNVPTGSCLSEYSQSEVGNSTEPSAVTITLPTDAACIPSTLVFTADQFVNANGSPTFGTLSVTTPEPGSLLLVFVGLAGLPFVRRFRLV
jgi:hypothetical protein